MNEPASPRARRRSPAPRSSQSVEELAELFKCLADPTRLRILATLDEHGTQCVHELCATLAMSQPAVSHQLRILRSARLVRGRRDGREIHYAIDDEHVLSVLREGRRHVRHGGLS